MRIGILVSGLPPEQVGGAEVQALEAARRLATTHTVTVFTRTTAVPPELASLDSCRVVTRWTASFPVLRFATDVVSTLALLAARRRELDVLLTYQSVIDGLLGVVARRLWGIPVVVFVRGEVEYDQTSTQSRRIGGWVFRQADRVLVQSPAIAAALPAAFEAGRDPRTARLVRAKVAVVPNGIELASSRPSDPRVVLFVGRLTAGKGVDVLIDAMRACPDEQLVIVGDGPERQRLEARAAGLDRVVFTGTLGRSDVERSLANAKMLVLPSRQEGQPNVILEAMARGVPVVATPVGGIPDLIRDGENGVIVAAGDAQATATAIRALSEHPEQGRALADRARERIAHHAWPVVVASLERELSTAARSTPTTTV